MLRGEGKYASSMYTAMLEDAEPGARAFVLTLSEEEEDSTDDSGYNVASSLFCDTSADISDSGCHAQVTISFFILLPPERNRRTLSRRMYTN